MLMDDEVMFYSFVDVSPAYLLSVWRVNWSFSF